MCVCVCVCVCARVIYYIVAWRSPSRLHVGENDDDDCVEGDGSLLKPCRTLLILIWPGAEITNGLSVCLSVCLSFFTSVCPSVYPLAELSFAFDVCFARPDGDETK
jgi:hypothetical protein